MRHTTVLYEHSGSGIWKFWHFCIDRFAPQWCPKLITALLADGKSNRSKQFSLFYVCLLKSGLTWPSTSNQHHHSSATPSKMTKFPVPNSECSHETAVWCYKYTILNTETFPISLWFLEYSSKLGVCFFHSWKYRYFLTISCSLNMKVGNFTFWHQLFLKCHYLISNNFLEFFFFFTNPHKWSVCGGMQGRKLVGSSELILSDFISKFTQTKLAPVDLVSQCITLRGQCALLIGFCSKTKWVLRKYSVFDADSSGL